MLNRIKNPMYPIIECLMRSPVMEIIKTVLFLFVINNSTPATTPAEIKEAFIGKWRVVEIVTFRSGKPKMIHQRMVYRFLPDGTVYAEYGTRRENVRWRMVGKRIQLTMPHNRTPLNIEPHFVSNTKEAWKTLGRVNSRNFSAMMFIRGMPDIDK